MSELLPVYNQRGELTGFVKQPELIGVIIGGQSGCFKEGQVMRVSSVNDATGAVMFEVLA